MPWKPIVDDFSSTPFMPMKFDDAIRGGFYDKNVSVLAGFTSEEGLVFTPTNIFISSLKFLPPKLDSQCTFSPIIKTLDHTF